MKGTWGPYPAVLFPRLIWIIALEAVTLQGFTSTRQNAVCVWLFINSFVQKAVVRDTFSQARLPRYLLGIQTQKLTDMDISAGNAPVITKSSCTAHRKGWVNLKSANHSWKDRFKWSQKQYVGTGGKFSFKIFIWHRTSFHKLQVYFLVRNSSFLHFFHFLKTFAVKIESNFEGFMSVLFLRRKILFSQQLPCVRQVVVVQHGRLSRRAKVGTGRTPGESQYSPRDFW